MILIRRFQWVRAAILALMIFPGGMLAGCTGQPVGMVPTLTPYPTVAEIQTIDVVCADFIAPALQSLALNYQRENPHIIITVVQRADTLGYPLLKEGDADIAVLTWLPDAIPETMWMRPLAYDGLAIIVHPQNGIPGLSQAQVQKLYQGQVENWADWGGLPGVPQLISRETASGEYLSLQNRVMRDVRTSLNATLAPDSAIMLKFVAEDPLAIGYVSTALLTSGVRAVSIDGTPPGQEAIRVNAYPLRRTIVVVTVNEPQEPERSFVQWMLGNKGQSVLYNYGFVSVLE